MICILFVLLVTNAFNVIAMEFEDGYDSGHDSVTGEFYVSEFDGFDDVVALARALSTRCSVSTAHLTQASEEDDEEADDEEQAPLVNFGGAPQSIAVIKEVEMVENAEDTEPEYTFNIGKRGPERSKKNKKNRSKVKKGLAKSVVSPSGVGEGISPLLLNGENGDASIQQSTKKARTDAY